jgi:hypothetical protein
MHLMAVYPDIICMAKKSIRSFSAPVNGSIQSYIRASVANIIPLMSFHSLDIFSDCMGHCMSIQRLHRNLSFHGLITRTAASDVTFMNCASILESDRLLNGGMTQHSNALYTGDLSSKIDEMKPVHPHRLGLRPDRVNGPVGRVEWVTFRGISNAILISFSFF